MTNTNTLAPSETLTDAELAAREDAIHAREMAEYEARMREADECDSPRYEDPVDLYGGDDYSNEYMEGDQGEW
jgi:hypothetical protein